MLQIFPKVTNFKLLIIFSISLSLLFTPVALAGFKLTNRKPATDQSRSAGRRGCPSPDDSAPPIPLTLLAPQTYVGYTTSLRPTFVGFVSNPQKVEFRIFEFISDKQIEQIGNKIIKDVKQSGVFKISLPDEYPNLSVGKKYIWQLTIRCYKENIFEGAEFIVVETPSTLKNKLSSVSNSLQKANIYAAAGFWYEALAEALQLANQGKLGKLGSTLVKNFAEYESPIFNDDKQLVQTRVQNLQNIATQQQN